MFHVHGVTYSSSLYVLISTNSCLFILLLLDNFIGDGGEESSTDNVLLIESLALVDNYQCLSFLCTTYYYIQYCINSLSFNNDIDPEFDFITYDTILSLKSIFRIRI